MNESPVLNSSCKQDHNSYNDTNINVKAYSPPPPRHVSNYEMLGTTFSTYNVARRAASYRHTPPTLLFTPIPSRRPFSHASLLFPSAVIKSR